MPAEAPVFMVGPPMPPELIPGLEPMFQLDPVPAPIPTDGEVLKPPEPDFLEIMGVFLPWDLSPAAARTLARSSIAAAASFGDPNKLKRKSIQRDLLQPPQRNFRPPRCSWLEANRVDAAEDGVWCHRLSPRLWES